MTTDLLSISSELSHGAQTSRFNRFTAGIKKQISTSESSQLNRKTEEKSSVLQCSAVSVGNASSSDNRLIPKKLSDPDPLYAFTDADLYAGSSDVDPRKFSTLQITMSCRVQFYAWNHVKAVRHPKKKKHGRGRKLGGVRCNNPFQTMADVHQEI